MRTKMNIKNRDFKGVWIPKEIWLDNNLTWLEKLLLTEIESLHGANGCFASNAYLAQFFNLSKTRISQVLTVLKNKEYITIEYERNGYGAEITKRVLKRGVKNPKGVFNILKGGVKNPKGGCLRNCKGINTKNNNKEEEEYLSGSPDGDNKGESAIHMEKKKQDDFIPYPYAKRLSSIVQRNKQIKHTSSQIKSWAESIRKLHSVNKVSEERIRNALRWYAKHNKDSFVPVIESGHTFREKFSRLEDAMKREANPISKPGFTLGSEQGKKDRKQTKYKSKGTL